MAKNYSIWSCLLACVWYASLIKARVGLSALNYSVDTPCLALSSTYNLSFYFCSWRPHMDRNKGQYFNNVCYLLAFLNYLLIKLWKNICLLQGRSPPCLAQSSMSKMKPKWKSLSLLHAFGSLQIDLIYYGPQNYGITYNFCHVSSMLLVKIGSPERKWFLSDSVQSGIVTYLLSIFSGEFKRENKSKTISTFIF